jgi:hypothetical protein
MLIACGDAQTLPPELNKAATDEVWLDLIFPMTDGVDGGTVIFSPNGRTVWHQHEYGDADGQASEHVEAEVSAVVAVRPNLAQGLAAWSSDAMLASAATRP